MNTPIYIQSLELQNIRTFGEKMTLQLYKKDKTIPQWTLILGDNGIGKSTLLQCIAWMKPSLPYGDRDEENLMEQPIINNEENEILEQLVRVNSTTAQVPSAIIKAIFIAGRRLNKRPSSGTDSTCETSITIELSQGDLKDVEAKLERKNEDTFSDGVLIYAYSASRQLGKLNMEDQELKDTIPAFISEKTVLYDAEEILHDANYAALGSNKNQKNESQNYVKKIKKMLVSILPDVERIEDIEILSPQRFGKKEHKKEVLITTKHGNKIPFANVSLGYKTAISWTIDLAWRLFIKYPDSKNPLAEPAIVLIDEIDLHLHPVWQREMMDSLSKHFPNTQFIATAHSPLMVQAAMESNYAVLRKCESGVEILNEPTGIDGWRIDQILTSEIFGLKSARGIKYEDLYRKREELIKKTKLKKTEKDELNTITEQLEKLPSGESHKEIENRKFIAEVVSEIKRTRKKIKL